MKKKKKGKKADIKRLTNTKAKADTSVYRGQSRQLDLLFAPVARGEKRV